MSKNVLRRIPGNAWLCALALTPPLSPAGAQLHSGPPSGDNQRAAVLQWIGPVEVRIDYSSPDVHAPDGADRRGKIWGGLVPWGYATDAFGTCGSRCPWRAGANQATTLSVSHDVEIQGKKLAAGKYGLFMLPGQEEWTLILSNDSTSWGHYTYDEAEDALRVATKPEKSPYREWLTYEFVDRRPDRATVALAWEELAVPFTIVVPDVNAIYAERIEQELRNYDGFDADTWRQAAEFYLDADYRPEEALRIAKSAVEKPFTGEVTFQNLAVLARAQEANQLADEGWATMRRALALPSANPIEIHTYARQLLDRGRTAEAVAVFETNAKRFPNQWPVNVGLARAYTATGETKKALRAAKAALAQAPDEVNRENLKRMIAELEAKG
jgi:tetratricopeptide (TPR) repeat protein